MVTEHHVEQSAPMIKYSPYRWWYKMQWWLQILREMDEDPPGNQQEYLNSIVLKENLMDIIPPVWNTLPESRA